jgi:DNA-binding response OmpR family regulator
MKLLLIEDDRGIASALSQALSASYSVSVVHTGFAGIDRAEEYDYDCILLDLNLPDISGLRVCELLRNQGCRTPILILTAETQVLSKIRLLDAGADDYLTKPFSLGELKARMRVLERRSKPSKSNQAKLTLADVTLDPSTHTVLRAGTMVNLRRKEFSLLECLMHNSGNVVTRHSLGEYAWSQLDSPWANTIDVHIKMLRDKFDRPFDGPMIKTIHGIGYKFVVPTESKD